MKNTSISTTATMRIPAFHQVSSSKRERYKASTTTIERNDAWRRLTATGRSFLRNLRVASMSVPSKPHKNKNKDAVTNTNSGTAADLGSTLVRPKNKSPAKTRVVTSMPMMAFLCSIYTHIVM